MAAEFAEPTPDRRHLQLLGEAPDPEADDNQPHQRHQSPDPLCGETTMPGGFAFLRDG
jgi:hypothetical protein